MPQNENDKERERDDHRAIVETKLSDFLDFLYI